MTYEILLKRVVLSFTCEILLKRVVLSFTCEILLKTLLLHELPRGSVFRPNSRHRFTTSFLRPLPKLITPQVSKTCQLIDRVFCLVFWCSNSSKFVTDNSDCIRQLFYNMHPRCLRQHKSNQIRLNREGTLLLFSTQGGCASCVRSCLDAMMLPRSY